MSTEQFGYIRLKNVNNGREDDFSFVIAFPIFFSGKIRKYIIDLLFVFPFCPPPTSQVRFHPSVTIPMDFQEDFLEHKVVDA